MMHSDARRVLAMWFPTLASDLALRRLGWKPTPRGPAHGRAGEAPAPIILLTRALAGRERVAACCRVASAVGVHVGMDLSQARSILPRRAPIHMESHRPDWDQRDLLRLARWMLRVSPVVAPMGIDALACDVTGTQRIYKGEERVARSIRRALARLGLDARVVMASTFACALGVARFGGRAWGVVPPGCELEALAPLPPAALGLSNITLESLHELNIDHAGQVIALPRKEVLARLGPQVLECIDRALGNIPERWEPIRPQPPISTALDFDGPTSHYESVHHAAKQTLEACVRKLWEAQRGVSRMDVRLLRPQAPAEELAIIVSRPTSNPRHLWNLLCTRLDKIDLAHGGGIEGVVVTATRTMRLRHTQLSSTSMGDAADESEQTRTAELLDTLVARLGTERVYRYELLESHLPEHSFRTRSVLEPLPKERLPHEHTLRNSQPRPTTLLERPEPIEVLAVTPDGPIVRLTWRGRTDSVLACIGPERIGSEWWRWKNPPPDRDYFALRLQDGRWVWACRQVGTSRWYVHGYWS